jgi:hypothetical protein
MFILQTTDSSALYLDPHDVSYLQLAKVGWPNEYYTGSPPAATAA